MKPFLGQRCDVLGDGILGGGAVLIRSAEELDITDFVKLNAVIALAAGAVKFNLSGCGVEFLAKSTMTLSAIEKFDNDCRLHAYPPGKKAWNGTKTTLF